MGVFLGLGVLGHFGSKTSDKENCQNSQRVWAITSLHVLFSVSKCFNIPNIYIIYKKNWNILV